MIEQKVAAGFFESASELLERMKGRISEQNIGYFLDVHVLSTLGEGQQTRRREEIEEIIA